ncbi:MAG: YciI family protein [Rhodospirillales bacterium]|nr:YciI family protein [Rhodospirillales bacterium]
MKYLLLIHSNEKSDQEIDPAEGQKLMGEYFAYTEALKQAGAWLGGQRLRPVAEAAVVRVGKNGAPSVLNGPFIETKEQLGGFYMIEAPDQEEAVRWASRCPGARYGTMEVRPIWDLPT